MHHGRHAPESLTHASARWDGIDLETPRELRPTGLNGHAAPAVVDPVPAPGDEAPDGTDAADRPGELDGSPVEIREKVHPAVPMTVEQALYEMELVGHDFYLFVDAANGMPSAMYRRKGWSYGVIRLAEGAHDGADRDAEVPLAAG